jgi:hypothetical protein
VEAVGLSFLYYFAYSEPASDSRHFELDFLALFGVSDEDDEAVDFGDSVASSTDVFDLGFVFLVDFDGFLHVESESTVAVVASPIVIVCHSFHLVWFVSQLLEK